MASCKYADCMRDCEIDGLVHTGFWTVGESVCCRRAFIRQTSLVSRFSWCADVNRCIKCTATAQKALETGLEAFVIRGVILIALRLKMDTWTLGFAKVLCTSYSIYYAETRGDASHEHGGKMTAT